MNAKSAENDKATFAPHLAIRNVAEAIEFYKKAFDAMELRRFSNPDGSVHVVEMTIGGSLFHIHEDNPSKGELTPEHAGGTTVIIEMIVENPDEVVSKAVHAGCLVKSPIQDYDYGYRQATLTDPFSHQWLIEKIL